MEKKTKIIIGVAVAVTVIVVAIVMINRQKKKKAADDAATEKLMQLSVTPPPNTPNANAGTPIQTREDLVMRGYDDSEIELIMQTDSYNKGTKYF